MDWENVWQGVGFVLVCAIIISIFLFAFSSKHHKGYYLMHGTEHNIYINWENAPDEIAYRTYNEKECLEVFEKLKSLEK